MDNRTIKSFSAKGNLLRVFFDDGYIDLYIPFEWELSVEPAERAILYVRYGANDNKVLSMELEVGKSMRDILDLKYCIEQQFGANVYKIQQ